MDKAFQEFRKTTAQRLRRARGELTQAQLGDITEYSQQMISRYESGRIPKAYWYLAGLSKAGVDIDFILTGRRRRSVGDTQVPPQG
ncbi:MAG: helix-turn-helix domain-containing protein [Gemmatimonadota bacterium]